MPTQPPKEKKKPRKRAKKFRDNVSYLDDVVNDSKYGSVKGVVEQVLDDCRADRLKSDNILITYLDDGDIMFKAHGLTRNDLIVLAEQLKNYALGNAGDDGE